MIKPSKFTSCLLITALLCSTLFTSQSVSAAQTLPADTKIPVSLETTIQLPEETVPETSNESVAASSESMTTEHFTTEVSTTRSVSGEETNEQPTTEAPTTEIPTTEKPTQEETTTKIPTTKKYVVSKLSPAASKVILLDPGHCSVHPGASGNGLKEEVAVLDIARACKKELNQYGNVTVYLTRTSSKCCEALHLGDCLTSRNNYAKRLSANFLISMHINADSNPSRTGALILPAYKSGYNDNIRIETQAMGKKILSELHSVGLKNTGFWLRKLDTGKYSNGAAADYYSIVRNGVLNNIPSLIIEHGYITNTSDCDKYFRTKAQRRQLGIADANAIVSYYNLKQNTITGTFVKENGATYYVTKDNVKVKGWVKDNGKWYYFSKVNGKMKTGFVTINKKKFYLNPSTGAMTVGWFTVKGYKYLAKGNGVVVKNSLYSDGVRTYLFNAKGQKYTKGLHKIKGKTYYVSPSTGTVVTNRIIQLGEKSIIFPTLEPERPDGLLIMEDDIISEK